MLYPLAVMPLRALGFGSTRAAGEVLCDGFGRPISLDPEMVGILASERWETDPSFPEVPSHLLSSHSWKNVMADRWCFDNDILRLEAWALVRPAEQYTTAGYCYSVTIFQWCSASTADDRATSDS